MIAERSKKRGLSEADYMGGNLLGLEVTAADVAQAFVSLAKAHEDDGCGGHGRRRQHRGSAALISSPPRMRRCRCLSAERSLVHLPSGPSAHLPSIVGRNKVARMPIEITPLTPHIGARLTASMRAGRSPPAEVEAIDAGMNRHAVLVLPGQDISDEQQLAFTRNFGPLEEGANSTVRNSELRLDPAFADVSNLDKEGQKLARDNKRRMAALGNRLWHSDASFRVVPAKYSILSGRIVTTAGGNTEFADMRAAYDALDAATKAEVEDLVCEHSLIYSRGQLGFTEFLPDERVAMKPVRHRLVRTHPGSGRKSLFLSAHIGTIVGWPQPEAMAFIRDLIEHATQPQFVYSHRWTQHDLVMWDNRATMHRVRRFDDLNIVRDMRRTTTQKRRPDGRAGGCTTVLPKRRVGKTKLEVATLGLGGAPMGGFRATISDAEAVRAERCRLRGRRALLRHLAVLRLRPQRAAHGRGAAREAAR